MQTMVQKIFQKIKGFFSKSYKEKHSAGLFHLYEPMQANRFIVRFPADVDLPPWSVSKLSPIEYNDNNWADITIHFRAFIAPPTITILDKFVQQYGDQSFVIEIDLCDPTGVVVQKFLVESSKIKKINFGLFNYGADEILEPFITISPSNVVVIPTIQNSTEIPFQKDYFIPIK
jgi:hypothetical protein